MVDRRMPRSLSGRVEGSSHQPILDFTGIRDTIFFFFMFSYWVILDYFGFSNCTIISS